MERFFYLLIAFMGSIEVCLASTETDNIKSALKTSVYEPNYFSIVLSLVFVIFLIYVTGIFYTKLNKVGIQTVKRELKEKTEVKPVVISTTPIGHDKTLQVVEIAGERLLLGVSQHSVNLIKSLGRSYRIEQEQTREENIVEAKVENITKEEHTVNADEFGLYKKYLR